MADNLPPFHIPPCKPLTSQVLSLDPSRPWEEVWRDAAVEHTCVRSVSSATTSDRALEQAIAVLERRNIIGVVSGSPEPVRTWNDAAPERFIPALDFRLARDAISPAFLRDLVERGNIAIVGEIANQYGGIAPADERMDLFGVYHVAHSPPFNEDRMIVLLTGVGVITSLVFFVGRDVYATMIVHNVLALKGVLAALVARGEVGHLERPSWPLLITAGASAFVGGATSGVDPSVGHGARLTCPCTCQAPTLSEAAVHLCGWMAP